jgi:hypothetical protein
MNEQNFEKLQRIQRFSYEMAKSGKPVLMAVALHLQAIVDGDVADATPVRVFKGEES